MRNAIIAIASVTAILMLVYSIKREFFKISKLERDLNKGKKYIFRTRAQIKIIDEGFSAYIKVIAYVFEQYIIVLTPSNSTDTNSINILFYKSEPIIGGIKCTTKAKLFTTDFSDNLLKISANSVELNLFNASAGLVEYHLLFEQIDESTKALIKGFK
jgi:hypothetical protein